MLEWRWGGHEAVVIRFGDAVVMGRNVGLVSFLLRGDCWCTFFFWTIFTYYHSELVIYRGL